MSFSFGLGRIVGWFAARFGVQKVREIKGRAEAKIPKPTDVAKIVVLAVLLVGATCVRDFGAGVASGGIDCLRNIDLCAPTPTPAAPTPATPAPPTPSATPTQSPAPSSTPTATPGPAPTLAPTRTPKPANEPPCNPTPPPAPVRPLTSGPCPRGLAPLDLPEGRLCLTDWPCGNPEARSCRTHMLISVAGNHVQITRDGDGSGCPAGFLWDGHPGPCSDAWCRPTFDGLSIAPTPPDNDKPWARSGICDPVVWPCAPPPTPTPAGPAPTPGPVTGGCSLPRGDGDGIDCPRTTSRHLRDVGAAIDRVIGAHPDWLVPGTEIVREGAYENLFRFEVVYELRRAGFCAFFDGEEIALKSTNGWSEQYHVLSSARHIRRGEGSYRATCTPAWRDIPAWEATPTPQPVADACPCIVAVTVAYLGINDGPPPVLRAGDAITFDATWRFAQGAGDGRGQPCDTEARAAANCGGRKCNPERGPDWTYSTPGGVRVRERNSGYALRMEDLKRGSYRVAVAMPGGLMDAESPAAPLLACAWEPGSSVRSVIEFEVE